MVEQILTEIKTAPYTFPQDSASIRSSVAAGLLPAGGSVVFKLFGPTIGPDMTGLQNCQATGLPASCTARRSRTSFRLVGAHEVTDINTANNTFKIDSSKNGLYY